MNHYIKTLLGFWVIASLWLWYTLTFWESDKLIQADTLQVQSFFKDADSLAQKYIAINKNDDLWFENNPRFWEITPLYMEKETPSYIEYAITCDRHPQCWFIIVNVDGDDVDIPIASPSDTPPSQIITKKSGNIKEKLKFYYFTPFDIYSINRENSQINALDPQVDPIEKDDFFDGMQEEEKKQMSLFIQKKKDKIPEKFTQQLQSIIEYKKSDDFIEFKQKMTEYSSWDALNNFLSPQTPGTEQDVDWKYVKWQSSYNCNSRIPCYEQHDYWYGWQQWWCYSGCAPVAASMILGYHDRVGNYPELLPWVVANDQNGYFFPSEIRAMINNIREYMGTTCEDWQWSTDVTNIEKGIKFAKNNGYSSSESELFEFWTDNMMFKIKTEINAWRPIILNIFSDEWHSVVWYWYFNPLNPPPNTTILPYVRINAGWWNGQYSNTNIYIYSINVQNKIRSLWSVVWYNVIQ